MTMITAITVTIFLTISVLVLPKMYLASLQADSLFDEEEPEPLQALLEHRNDWIFRHLACAIGALIIVWMMQNTPGVPVNEILEAGLGVYAGASLLFALLETMLALKISCLLDMMPARVKVRRDQ
jgi:hypothetical protein